MTCRSLRARLDRLERRRPAPGAVRWENLLAGGPEEVAPDGSGIDWAGMFARPDGPCPVEAAIAEVEALAPPPQHGRGEPSHPTKPRGLLGTE